MVDIPNTPQNHLQPRGTDRVRRREAQAKHAEQAVVEAANLVPPKGDEKAAQIAANKAKEVARFGGQSPAKAKQAEHRQQAQVQDAEFSGVNVIAEANLIPGQQVDARTARLFAKAHDRQERDVVTQAAKAAGVAVFDTLKGQRPLRDRHTRQRHIAQHNNRVALAAAAKAE